jgi:hypothetical protein
MKTLGLVLLFISVFTSAFAMAMSPSFVSSGDNETDDAAPVNAIRTTPVSASSSAPPPTASSNCSVQSEQDKIRSNYVPDFETELPPCAQAAPVVEKAERAPVDILIVTDQESGEHAEQIEEAFKNTPPFKCMDLKYLIVKKSVSELDCQPASPKNILKCMGTAAKVVRKIKNSNHARSEIVSVTYDLVRGGNWTNNVSDKKKIRQAFTSTAQNGRGAVHESLHTIGFEDEYPEGRVPVPRGTIMNSYRDGDIPQVWWPAIANFYGVDVPASCP